MKRWQKWVLGTVGGLVVAFGAFVLLFNWNWLRGTVAEQASKQTGRKIELGDFQGQWSLAPTLSLRDVHIANADWGKAPELFSAELMEVTVDLRELMRGRTVLREIKLVKPDLALEVREDGTTNWDLVSAAEPVKPDDRTDVPLVGKLDIQDGRLRYADPKHGLDLDGKIHTVVASGGEGEGQVELTGNGTLQGQPFEIQFTGGSLLSLREDKNPYPVSVDIKAVGSRGQITGTLDDPIKFDGLDLRARLTGPDLSRLTTISGVPLPITPKYDLNARLQREEKSWSLTDIDGDMGHSDLHGALKFDLGGERLYIEADLASHKLDYRDVGFLIGVQTDAERDAAPDHPAKAKGSDKKSTETKPSDNASADAKAGQSKSQRGDAAEPKRVLPDAPLSVQQVRSTDAKVKFHGDRVDAPNVPLSSVALDLDLRDGVLHLMPLRVGVAGGTAIADIKIDARREEVVTDYDVKLKAFQLHDFLASAGFEKAGRGRIDGRIRLVGVGNTVRKSLGNSDGDIRLVINHGEMSNLAIEIVGLDVAEALGLWATKDKDVEIRCFVADLGVRKGVASPRLFLLDTTDSMVDVEGAADLRSELMDFSIKAHPKDTSVLSLRAPILVKGSFAEPSVGVDKAALAARGAAAAALGTLLTPLASILAFIDPGLQKDSDCGALVDQVQAPANVKTPDKIEAPR